MRPVKGGSYKVLMEPQVKEFNITGWATLPSSRTGPPGAKLFQHFGVSQRRSVTKADHPRLEVHKGLYGTPVLGHIDREKCRWLPKSKLARQEVDVGQHVACDAKSIRITEEHAVAGCMAWCVDYPEASHFVTVFQDKPDRTRWPSPQPLTEADHPVVWQHRHPPFGSWYIGSMTG